MKIRRISIVVCITMFLNLIMLSPLQPLSKVQATSDPGTHVSSNQTPIGYASMNGGTTGGYGAETYTEYVLSEYWPQSGYESPGEAMYQLLRHHIKKPNEGLIIFVDVTISQSNFGRSKMDVKDVSNVSILGVGTNGEFDGVGFTVSRSNNIVIQNLSIHHVRQGDGTAIDVTSNSSNIWIDHNDLYSEFYGNSNKNYYDGLVDIKRGAEYITVSWNKFHDHWKTSLNGHTDDPALAPDKITYHNNYFHDVESRVPLIRYATVHMLNNYFKDIRDTAINARNGAQVLVEGNYFENVGSGEIDPVTGHIKGPVGWFYGSPSTGYWNLIDNVYVNSPHEHLESTTDFTVPYAYTALSAEEAKVLAEQFTGVGIIDTTGGRDLGNPPGDPVEPSAPQNVQAIGGNQTVTLTWNHVADASSYVIKRSPTSAGEYLEVGTSTTNSYTDTGLTNGTIYYYVVVAVNEVGNSEASDLASATPQAPGNTDPSNPGSNEVFFDNFEGATTSNLFTTEYKSLPSDSSKAMYIKTGGTVTVDTGSVILNGGRMTIGALSNTTTTSSSTPGGVFDLSKPYKIKVYLSNASGSGRFQVYVDNNTTSQGNSIHGAASKVYEVAASSAPLEEIVIESEVGTTTSFIQIRTESSASVTIDKLTIEYIVSETETPELVWQSITFGQSTDLNFAANVLPDKVGTNYADPDVPGTIEGTILLESRGGKLAPGHDGLTYYYTILDPNLHNFVLEADMIIEQFGPETGAAPNSQDSAGIMVRDVNSAPRQDPMIVGYEEVPAASNIFGVGMMRHGISPIYRTGVLYPWGNLGSQFKASAFSGGIGLVLNTPIKVKLERTDTEFIMSATFTDSNTNAPKTVEQRIQGADMVQVIDPNHMHVGFYAARNAKMLVQNARITLSEANTLPTPVVEPAPPNPAMNIVSAPQFGSADYKLRALANYNGTVSVSKNGTEVVSHEEITANKVYEYNTTLENDTTDFMVIYTPSEAPSTNPITREISVTKKIFNSGAGLFVSPDGTNVATGTINDPLDLVTAIQYVLPGETIFMRGGTYTPSSTINIQKQYSGEEGKMKRIVPYNGEKVVIDGNNRLNSVLQLNADYWHLYGIQITRASGTAMRLSGDHNTIEMMVFNYNGNTGFHISGSGTNPDNWPKYNLILNCESHDNRDPANIDADGFAAKLGVGVGNVFRGNIAHHNIDDGWDLYNRTNEGPNMPIVLDGNIAYSNGKLSDGYNQDGNTGNGFKLGGEGLPVAHIVKNNLAFDNNMDGFTDNFNPGALIIENNTSFDNKRFNYIFRSNPYFTAEEQGIYKNNLSFRSNPESGIRDFISGNVDETNFFFDGENTVNSNGLVVTVADFLSIMRPLSYERDAEGTIIWGDFLRLAMGSALNTAGTSGSYVGALPAIESNVPEVTAHIKFDPAVLNLRGLENRSNNNQNNSTPLVTVYIQLQSGFNLEGIQLDTIRLNDEIMPSTDKGYGQNPIGDFDSDGLSEYMVKFSRHDLASIVEKGERVPITITGQLNSGHYFKGTTYITVK